MEDGPIENLPDFVCVLVHGGYTVNPELLLVDKVSIERPKSSICLVWGEEYA